MPSEAWMAQSGVRTTALAAALLAVLAGCAKKRPVSTPAAPPIGWAEVGIASWYGHPYHGRHAANGEVYDMDKMTAAHRTLPFGSWVLVRNLENNKKVQVRITDRGPFVKGRVIDLSRAAAREIDMIGPGTAKVRIEVIAPSASPPETEFYTVQVGAFRDRSNADRLRKTMEQRYGECRLALRDGSPRLWRVLVGREPTLERANALAGRLRSEVGEAFVVRLDEPANNRL